jgi:hypothetical protein
MILNGKKILSQINPTLLASQLSKSIPLPSDKSVMDIYQIQRKTVLLSNGIKIARDDPLERVLDSQEKTERKTIRVAKDDVVDKAFDSLDNSQEPRSSLSPLDRLDHMFDR